MTTPSLAKEEAMRVYRYTMYRCNDPAFSAAVMLHGKPTTCSTPARPSRTLLAKNGSFVRELATN
jgi:hypothetical protein